MMGRMRAITRAYAAVCEIGGMRTVTDAYAVAVCDDRKNEHEHTLLCRRVMIGRKKNVVTHGDAAAVCDNR